MNDPLQPQQPTPQYAPVPPTSGLAIASLVCGIVSLVLCWCGVVAGIPAIVCGHLGLSAIKKSGGAIGGYGLALAGTITGYIGMAMSLFLIIAYGALFLAGMKEGFEKARERAEERQQESYQQEESASLPTPGLRLPGTPWRLR